MNIERWEAANTKQRRNKWVRKKRIKGFGIDKSKYILDYGCGDGIDLEIFGQLGYTNILGLDQSCEYISRLKAKYNVVLADACNTGLPTHSVDVVFADGVLHHLELNLALKEIKRILKVGGELCFLEPRHCIARSILDTVTMTSVLSIFTNFSNRRISLIEERQTYDRWLNQQSMLSTILEAEGFAIRFYRKRFITLMVKCVSM